jgi:hypothetical protein
MRTGSLVQRESAHTFFIENARNLNGFKNVIQELAVLKLIEQGLPGLAE